MHALKFANFMLFLSTLSLRRATDCAEYYIHAPEISIHALLAESDRLPTALRTPHQRFLSTLSLRRATCQGQAGSAGYLHFYPRSPCGERPIPIRTYQYFFNFYPRSPCGERPWARGSRVTYVEFLSTLSLRRATRRSVKLFRQNYISIHALLAESDNDAINGCNPDFISIHALLAESDCYSLRHSTQSRHFYPRSPCGERQKSFRSLDTGQIFLSTLSLRRATAF